MLWVSLLTYSMIGMVKLDYYTVDMHTVYEKSLSVSIQQVALKTLIKRK